MAPRQRYAGPLTQLRRLAVAARDGGVDFDAWWNYATRPHGPNALVTSVDPPHDVVLWPSDGTDRAAWQAAIAESKESWRRAYERLPATPEENAVGELLSWLAEGLADQTLATA